MQTASLTSGSAQANVDSYVSACKCNDLDSFACDNTPIAPNDVLSVCIQSMDSDVEIAFLSQLQLFQGDSLDNETLVVVDGLVVQNTEISAMRTKNATAIGVETVVPSRFFSYTGMSTATVSGVVHVKLVGPSRGLRRLAFDYPTVKSDIGGRKTRGDPGYGGGDDSSFEVTIGMERQAAEPRFVPANNSGATKSLQAATRALGAVVSFAWILFW